MIKAKINPDDEELAVKAARRGGLGVITDHFKKSDTDSSSDSHSDSSGDSCPAAISTGSGGRPPKAVLDARAKNVLDDAKFRKLCRRKFEGLKRQAEDAFGAGKKRKGLRALARGR